MNRYTEVTGYTTNGRRIVFFRADENRSNRVNAFLRDNSVGKLPFDLVKVEKVSIISGIPRKTGKVFEGVGYAY
ncbi:MAG: hypothetical protein ACI9JN_000992 [Bacteroidia bacterium]|jgi:hypothetical protein